jgi:hypothetical protein
MKKPLLALLALIFLIVGCPSTPQEHRLGSYTPTPSGTGFVYVVGGVQQAAAVAGDTTTISPLDWAPSTGADTHAPSQLTETTTTDATVTTAASFTQAAETAADYSATVIGRSTAGDHFRLDLRAAYSNTAGTFTTLDTPSTTAALSTTNPSGWAAVFDQSGTAVRVRVTGAAGKTVRWSVLANAQVIANTVTVTVFDPATLNASLWLKPTYTASPWTSTASAGASGGRSASEATNPPTTATALNGKVGALFNGTNQLLTASIIESSAFTASAGSVSILYKANSGLSAAGSNALNDAGLLQGTGGYFGIGVNSTGVSVRLDDGASGRNLAAAATHNGSTWNLAQVKWDGTNLKVRVNSGSWVTGTCGAMGNLTSALKIGVTGAVYYFPGVIEEVFTSPTTLSDANFDNIKSYVNSTYSLAL